MKDNNRDVSVQSPTGLRDAARRWAGDWGGRLTLAYGALTLVYLFYIVFRWGGEECVVLVGDIVGHIICFGPCLIAWRVSVQRHDGPDVRAD